MSGRFARLEFGEHERRQNTEARQTEATGTPVRTAAQDMGQAVAAYRTGEFETALRMYTHALQLERNLIPAWVGQVQMLVELGEYSEARLWSDKALELFRNNGDLLAAKSRACLRIGDMRAATACSDASVASPGTSPLRWQARGEMVLSKNLDRARDCFEKSLVEVQADWFDRVVIARVYLFHNRATSAVQYAQAAVEMQSGHAYCWYVLGRCQHSVGWSDRAEESYLRAMEISPRFGPARKGLEDLKGQSLLGRLRQRLKGKLSA